ncbi:hypothetical protein [Leuconostoc mesenteroides]|uniref:hypothetical protein n=1 Tax=Leuconostoc mesenteroides TaxID=1245 RepID=UPI0030CB6F5E
MKINKSVALNAWSSTEAGEQIAYFSANVSSDGTNSSMSIQNQTLYETNKSLVRKDKAAFDDAVYEVEDAQASATTAG